MLSRRVSKLLDAYFNRPLEEYIEVVLSVKERGGLSSAEVRSIKGHLLYIHAYTILRHVELAGRPTQDRRNPKLDFALEPLPHDSDVRALLRISVVWNIPIAYNRVSADFMISSPMMLGEYERLLPDYDYYKERIGGGEGSVYHLASPLARILKSRFKSV